MSQPPDWKRFERLVAAIHHAESSGGEVCWNDSIQGRQFDVTIRFKFGLHDYLTVIECKDYAGKVSVEKIDAFVTKARDAKANKAIMVSTNGYQSGSIEVAERHGIKLLVLNETLEVNDEEITAALTPALNVFAVRFHLTDDGSEYELEEASGRLAYLMRHVKIRSGAEVATPDQLIYQWQLSSPHILFDQENKIELVLEKDSEAEIPYENIFKVSALRFKCQMIDAIVPNRPILDSHVREALATGIELKDTNGVVQHSSRLLDLNLGYDKPVEVGRFYSIPALGNHYYCEAIKGDLIYWILVESYQYGQLIRARLTQLVRYSGQYVTVTDTKVLTRLQRLLDDLTALESRDCAHEENERPQGQRNILSKCDENVVLEGQPCQQLQACALEKLLGSHIATVDEANLVNHLLVFFFPYIMALHEAAYNINQALQGMIKHSPNPAAIPAGAGPLVSIFESPLDTNSIWLLLIAYCTFVLLPALLISGYVIKQWKGCVLALVVLMLPGILTVLGVFPAIGFLPREFVIDALGVLGEAGGMFPLVLLALISGWSALLILSDALQLNDNFRHLYDHVWYATAVVTGIFFVVDVGAAHTTRELQTENDLSRQASAYLLRQVRDYDLHCQSMKMSSKPSCTWASQVQEKLNDYSIWSERLYYTVGPKNTAAIYDPFSHQLNDAKISAIRRELKEFNENRCPRKASGNGWYQSVISGTCQRPPGAFLKVFPEPLDGQVDHDAPVRTVAVANEIIIPSLVASRDRQERLKLEADQYKGYVNLKWIFYILFSLAAGGKVANSTARILNIGKQPPDEQRRSLQALRLTWNGLKAVIKVIASLTRRSWYGLGRLLANVLRLKPKN